MRATWETRPTAAFQLPLLFLRREHPRPQKQQPSVLRRSETGPPFHKVPAEPPSQPQLPLFQRRLPHAHVIRHKPCGNDCGFPQDWRKNLFI